MSDDKTAASRRDFLKLAGAGVPAAAAAAIAPGSAAAAVEQGGEGLQNTDHTRKYFETARF